VKGTARRGHADDRATTRAVADSDSLANGLPRPRKSEGHERPLLIIAFRLRTLSGRWGAGLVVHPLVGRAPARHIVSQVARSPSDPLIDQEAPRAIADTPTLVLLFWSCRPAVRRGGEHAGAAKAWSRRAVLRNLGVAHLDDDHPSREAMSHDARSDLAKITAVQTISRWRGELPTPGFRAYARRASAARAAPSEHAAGR